MREKQRKREEEPFAAGGAMGGESLGFKLLKRMAETSKKRILQKH